MAAQQQQPDRRRRSAAVDPLLQAAVERAVASQLGDMRARVHDLETRLDLAEQLHRAQRQVCDSLLVALRARTEPDEAFVALRPPPSRGVVRQQQQRRRQNEEEEEEEEGSASSSSEEEEEETEKKKKDVDVDARRLVVRTGA